MSSYHYTEETFIMGSTSPQIKNFIITAYEYQRKRTDKNLMQIQRQLQILSVISDLHIFEPTCMETLEFYVCLEKLLNTADAKSTLAWKIITLFAHLSQSQSIRVCLRDDIKLVPVLCDFLIDSKFNNDKTYRILQLIEAVSYKIKISHVESWVIKLVQFLATIIKCNDGGNIFAPAVSILANLCRFNPPALACFRGYGSTKAIIQSLVDVKNPTVKERLLAAEMMLYLHQDFSRSGRNCIKAYDESVLDCILKAAGDGFAENDISSLQLATDIFTEFSACPTLGESLRRDYSSFTKKILKYLTPESPELSVELLFDLLNQIISLDQSTMQPLYEDIFAKVIPWLKTNQCSISALRVLRTLVMNDSKFVDSPQLEEFIAALVISLDMDGVMHLSSQKLLHINSILIILKELCNHDTSLRVKLSMTFQVSNLSSLLKLIIGDSSASIVNETSSIIQTPVSIDSTWRELQFPATTKHASKTVLEDRTSLAVVQIMNIVRLFGLHNGDFLMEFEQMMNNPGAMKHLNWCECSGNPDMITEALTVLTKGGLPSASLEALVNAKVESCKSSSLQALNSASHSRNEETVNAFSSDMEDRVNVLLSRLQGTVDKLELKDTNLSAVMHMYEYQLANMAHTEQTLENALAASNAHYRQTYLSLMQTRAETEHLRKLLITYEDRFSVMRQEKAELQDNITQIQNSSKQFREKLIKEKTSTDRVNNDLRKELKEMKNHIQVRDENIEKLHRQVEEAIAENKSLQQVLEERQEKNQKLKVQIQKLEDDVKKSGKDYGTLEKECQRLEKVQAELKKENLELEQLIHSHEEAMASKETELEQVTKKFNDLKRIQDLIHNMSAGKMNMNM